LPEQLRARVEQHLQALLQRERVEREELRSILTEARQLSELDSLQELRAGRERLDEQWQRVQALVLAPPGRQPLHAVAVCAFSQASGSERAGPGLSGSFPAVSHFRSRGPKEPLAPLSAGSM
jgi:hypothetical protein